MKRIIIFCILIYAQFLSGQGWSLIYTFNESLINSIIFKDPQNGFAAGTNIYRTTDGGKTWNNLLITNLNTSINKIKLINNDIIGVGGGGTIIRSTDGGNTWLKSDIGYTDDLVSVCGTNNGALFVCSYTKIFRSTDNGKTWSSFLTDALVLWDIDFANDNIGFGVGLYNTSVKTTNGGLTWISISPIISGRSMFGIKFINNNVGYVIGGEMISKTVDGGNTWLVKYNTGGSQLNGITTWGENIAWAVGGDYILKTINAGENWFQQSFSPYHDLQTSSCLDSMICFVSGGEGALYKTTDGGGVTDVMKIDEKPYNFDLAQNYPNPFNPTTKIKYSILQGGAVTLKIFDILGREIEIVVNGYQSSGNYEVEFAPKSLSDGVYIYRLQAGDRYLNRKMIYLK